MPSLIEREVEALERIAKLLDIIAEAFEYDPNYGTRNLRVKEDNKKW